MKYMFCHARKIILAAINEPVTTTEKGIALLPAMVAKQNKVRSFY
jgi:hypothetical protein